MPYEMYKLHSISCKPIRYEFVFTVLYLQFPRNIIMAFTEVFIAMSSGMGMGMGLGMPFIYAEPGDRPSQYE